MEKQHLNDYYNKYESKKPYKTKVKKKNVGYEKKIRCITII